MSKLICPKCRKSPLLWITDMDDENLLETGIMECVKCKAQYVGISGWKQAWDSDK